MRSSQQLFDDQFLQMRERCLSLAADLDRIDRGSGGWATVQDEPRLIQLRQAISILLEASPGRAGRVLDVFSDHTTTAK